jgi:hypothetical protein
MLQLYLQEVVYVMSRFSLKNAAPIFIVNMKERPESF